MATQPGQLTATSRVLGFTVTPGEGQAGELWAINSDKGSMYLLTTDGLFLAELGGDVRVKPLMRMQSFQRGMIIEDVSFNDEHFWPTITPCEDDGSIYIAAGKEHTSLFRLTGFESVRRIAPQPVPVTQEMLASQPPTRFEPAVSQPNQTATILVDDRRLQLDGNLDDWSGAEWLTIDASRNLHGAVAIHGDYLCAAWKVSDPNLLANKASDGWRYAFASGGGLDLMLRTNPDAEPPKGRWYKDRQPPVAGDLRLFVTRLGNPTDGRVLAVLSRQAGEDGPDAHHYTSPIGEVSFSAVIDLSDHVQLAQSGGNYELAVPLRLLDFSPVDGTSTLGDIGVLIGNGLETQARLYWNNKAATIVSDIPSEARLLPEYWGTWTFHRAESDGFK